MIEDKARAKLSEIRAERERQMEERMLALQETYGHCSSHTEKARKAWESQVKDEFADIEKAVQKAMHTEKEYERCDYRRTHCKALESLIALHNKCKIVDWTSRSQDVENTKCNKYIFNQYGNVESETKFLVDPERFWSYDLLRSKEYGERPL